MRDMLGLSREIAPRWMQYVYDLIDAGHTAALEKKWIKRKFITVRGSLRAIASAGATEVPGNLISLHMCMRGADPAAKLCIE